jgi:hypothetical protein
VLNRVNFLEIESAHRVEFLIMGGLFHGNRLVDKVILLGWQTGRPRIGHVNNRVGLPVMLTKASLRDALTIVRVDRPVCTISVSRDGQFRNAKFLRLDLQAQGKTMTLFHDDHAPNVAVDLFVEPSSEKHGIAELGVNSLAVCSATTATSALVPKQCKHLQPKHSVGLQQRSELSSTYPAPSEEGFGIISHTIT